MPSQRIGGSLGAQVFNEQLPEALAMLPEGDRPVVRHQCGERHAEAAKQAYEEHGVEAAVEPFIKDMAEAYQWADLVLCRAGALTVSELCAAGIGANQYLINQWSVEMGGHARTGLEDNVRLDRETLAPSNAALVSRVVERCDKAGRPVATPAQARELLGLKPAA